jgi:hypothetical protein
MSTKRGSTPVRSEEHNSYFQATTIKQSQYINFTSTSKKSAILSDETSLVEIFPSQDCWITVMGNADTQPTPPASEQTIVVGIKKFHGGIHDFVGIPPNITNPVIAVISNGVDGVLDITEGD